MFNCHFTLHRRCLIALFVLGIALAPLPKAAAQAPRAPWTVLVYLDADNNLESDAIDDFLEMAALGSNSEVNVVVQLDRIPGYDRRYGDWTGTLRFRVTQGMTPDPANALADLGEANMADPQTLIDFVRWGQATYPAERSALVIWNHGDGWRTASALKENRKAICWDDTSGRDALDMSELRQALAAVTANGASPIDLLAFDACLMAMIEVDAQLRPYVRVRAASEDTEPSSGYPFDAILADLRAHPGWSAAELGTAIVDRYYETYKSETQSAVDLGAGYASLVTAVDRLAQSLLAEHAGLYGAIQSVRRDTQQFYGNYVDLYDLAEKLAAAAGGGQVTTAAQAVMSAVQGVTLREHHGAYWPGAHGVSIFFPAQPSGWDSAYSGDNDYLSFTAQTHWDEFLVAHLELAAACDPDAHEPDDDPADASQMPVGGQPQRHNFCPARDSADWIAFQAAAGQTVEISTSELGVYCDTVLRLYDADGRTLLTEDDDSGPGWASQIEWTSKASATYYVQVSEYYGRTGQDTGYTLALRSTTPVCQPDPHEPDSAPGSAAPIAVDGPAQAHTFCPQDDLVDWARFQAVQGQAYAIETLNLGSETDTVLALYDRNGTTSLLTDDDSGDGPGASRLEWTCPASGRYYVRVHEKQGRTGARSNYELRVSTRTLTVRGKVLLQGRTSYKGTQVAVLPAPDAPPADTVTTADDGSFTIAAAPSSKLRATHPGYLAHYWRVPQTEAQALALDAVTLLGGDVNADLLIDILDIAYIGAKFGSNDPKADINQDGIVDILDLVMPASNFGQSSGAL